MRWNEKVILLKAETVYGTDATPDGTVAVKAFNVTFNPNDADTQNPQPVKPFLGAEEKPIVGRHVTLQFDLPATGAGAVDQAPAFSAALRACGLSETITPTTGPVEYEPVSSAFESATIYFAQGRNKHPMLGCRGNVELVVEAGDWPWLRYNFTGLHVDPSDAALPVPDYSAFQKPLELEPGNTPTFTLDGYTAQLRSLNLNLGHTVNHLRYVNSQSVDIGDRAASGSVTIQAPGIAAKDFFAIAKARTLVPLQMIHGTAAGAIFQVDAPNVQLINPRYTEVDGIAHLQMDLNLVPSDAGNDELKITTK